MTGKKIAPSSRIWKYSRTVFPATPQERRSMLVEVDL